MMGFGFGGMGTVYMIIFWVVIIAAAVWFLSQLFPRGTSDASAEGTTTPNASSDSPQEILDRRYASGEIAKAEYDEISRDLGG
jgi:putative membrane protein